MWLYMSTAWPVVFAADVDDLWEGSLGDDGSDILRVALAEVSQDLTKTTRRRCGQVGASVVIGQHLHHLRQHMLHYRSKKQENLHKLHIQADF